MKVLIILLLLCSVCYAGDYVCHTSGTITSKYRSVDGADLIATGNCIKVTRETLEGITKYHKVENNQVVEMTQAEKDALDQTEAYAQEQALLAQIDKYEVSNLDLLTALIKRINVRIPSNPITKQEIVDQIKSDLGL